MKLDRRKTQLAQASAQMTTGNLCKAAGITAQAYRRAMSTGSRPMTIGRIAAALGVPVEDIVEVDDRKGERN